MPKTVMLVDDDRTTADVLSQMLRVLGHRAEIFRSPSECLEWLESNAPDLAIVDIAMPEIDGPALMKEIRARGSSFPIVVLTGRPESPGAERAKQLGAIALVAKPMSIDILQGLLELTSKPSGDGEAPPAPGDQSRPGGGG
jgi:CheY-like chemotaxis protein